MAEKKKRFDQREWDEISDHIIDTLEDRRDKRSDREKVWKDIDRQIEMTPDVSHKLDAKGRPDPTKAWLPEVELPLQAQTLEILAADAKRMQFPDSGPWFQAHAAITDDYLEEAELSTIIVGDKNEVPSLIDQDAADKLVAGAINHWHSQYDFSQTCDKINAESFKYGMGLARVRPAKKKVFLNTAAGVFTQEQRFPVVFPRSIRNTYLDTDRCNVMNEGYVVGPSVIFEEWKKLDDVKMAAKGSTDPKNMDGGWMPKQLSNIPSDKHGLVRIVEMEGDFIIPRKTTESIYIPNAIVTVCVGKEKDKSVKKVVRFRFNPYPFSTYLEFPYHYEGLSGLPTSPLIKGWPIQKAATHSMSRLLESAALKNAPPVGYDADDVSFAKSGGPVIHPYVMWPTTGNVVVYDKVGGDPSAMQAMYIAFLQQYADVTGVNAPRLGAQTVSHTTAFAKDAELSRGVIRTVDYIRSILKGPMTKLLYMEYAMGRDLLKESTLYIDQYRSFVTIDKKHLPEESAFEVHGAGGPQEEVVKQQQRMTALQTAMQIDNILAQTGQQPNMDLKSVQEQILREGGWNDIDLFFAQVTQGEQQLGQLPGVLSEAPV